MAATLAAAAVLAVVPAAAWAQGQIGYDGCLGNTAAHNCGDLPGEPLTNAVGVAVSPDSGAVYATGLGQVLHFFAAPQGQLVYDGCLGNSTAHNCGDLTGSPLMLASGVAVRPDNGSVYVASAGSDSISHFFKAPGGQLVFGGCLADDAADGCGDLPLAPLTSAVGVAVSPDSNSLYVASFTADSVSHFFVAPQGQLTFGGCLANDASQGCGDLPNAPLDGAFSVAVSPDNNSVYVASRDSGTVSHFFKAPTGQLTFGGCVGNDGAQGCLDLPFSPLSGAGDVAVSADGRSVYVASNTSNSVAHFFRAPQGQLVYDGCLANDGSQGCGDLPNAPLSGAQAVAVSPDSRSVYVASITSNSVAHFFRAPQGQIAYDGCLANTGAQGCGDLPGDPLTAARSVAVSPDGDSVYAVSRVAETIAHFFRAQTTAPPAGSVRTPGERGRDSVSTPGVQRCQGRRATIVGTALRDRLRGTRRADVIVSLGGNDRISAGRGNDRVCAGSGNDRARGSAGRDRLFGQGGKDRLAGGSGNDKLNGGGGKDRVNGGSGRDNCNGGPGKDRGSCEGEKSI